MSRGYSPGLPSAVQIYQIHQVLIDARNLRQTNSPLFKNMVIEHKLNELSDNIYLVISGYIKPINLNYIVKCNEGITEEEYNDFEFQNLINSYEFLQAAKTIKNFNLRMKCNTLDEFIIKLENELTKEPDNIYLKSLKNQINPYHKMEPYLQTIEDKIGYLFYDEEYLQYLDN